MASKKFSRLSILLEAKDKMSNVFNRATNASKKLSNNVDNLGGTVKKVKKDFDYSKSSIFSNTKEINKNADAAKKSVLSQTKLAKSIRSAALTMNLYSNGSTKLSKIKDVANAMLTPFRKLSDVVKANVRSFSQLNSEAGKLSGRRATFNQLADANQKLNRQLEKMNRELSKANSGLGSMRTSMGSLNVMGAAFTGMYTGQMAAQAGQGVLTDTVGYSWEQQYAKQGVGILAGEENGEAFYNKILDYASSTVYSPEDWSANLRGAIGKSKSVEELELYMKAIEQLATLDPVQGLDGSALAIRELNSGDSKSLVERFELSRTSLDEIRKIEDPIEQLKQLMEQVGKETGFTAEKIANMKELPLMQFEKAKNIWKTMKGYIGEAAGEKLAPLVKQFNDAWDAGQFDGFIKKASDLLSNIVGGLIKFTMNFSENYNNMVNSFKDTNGPIIELFNNVKKTFNEAKPTFKEIADNVVSIVNKIAGVGNDVWPAINSVVQFMLNAIEKVTGFIDKHFETITALLAGVAGSTLFLGIAKAFTWIGAVIKAILGGTFLAMFPKVAAVIGFLISPLGLVTVAIGLLVAAGVWLYKNWDMVSEKAGKAWDYVKAKVSELWDTFINSPIMWFIGGPIATLIGAIGWTIENWDLVKTKLSEFWTMLTDNPITDFVKGSWALLVDGVEWMGELWDGITDKFNNFKDALAGFKLPDWVSSIGSALGGAASAVGNFAGKAFGMSHHGGINNVPHDGYRAVLHKGERVLTRQENKELGQGAGGIAVSGNTFIIREEADIDRVIDGLYRKIEERLNVRG